MPLQLSASLNLTGSLNLSGSMTSTQVLNITSSNSLNALTSSYISSSNISGTVISASYALSSSFAPTNITASWSNNSVTASYVTGSVHNSFNPALSSSYALSASFAPTNTNITASWSQNSISASYSLTSSYSLNSGTTLTTGSTYPITASWSNNSLTASYVTASNVIGTVTSASYALSASFAPTNTNITASWSNNSVTASYVTGSVHNSSNPALSSSYALTASFSPTTITASWATNSLTASYVTASNVVGTVTSASYSLTSSYVTGSIYNSSNPALSASYALTASFAQNAGGTTLTTGSTYPITASWANNAISASYAPGGAATLSGGTTNYIPLWTSTSTLSTSSIYQTGSNVGIGTTSPSAKLTIVDDTNGGTINLVGRTSDDTAAINFRATGDGSTYAYIAPDTNEFRLYHNDGYMTFYPGGSEKMRITTTGDILISTTTSPSSAGISLGATGTVRQILGGMQNTSWRIREKSAVDWCAWTTNINDAGTQDDATKSAWLTQQGFGNGNDAWRVGRYPAGSSALSTFIQINSSGNVGIGTTSPTAKLHVTGSTGGIFEVDTTGGATTFYVSASGNIGVGTINPVNKLDVVGNISASSILVSDITASGMRLNNSLLYTEAMTTGSLTNPDIYFSSSAQTGSDVTFRIETTAFTGSSVGLHIIASGSQPSYALSASRGDIIGTGFTGSIFTGSFTGSYFGTSSWSSNSVTASYVTGSIYNSSNPALSASYALSASFAPTNTNITASWSNNSVTASYVTGSTHNSSNPALSSSYALTASFALNSAGGGGGTTLTTGSTYPITSSWAQSSSVSLYAPQSKTLTIQYPNNTENITFFYNAYPITMSAVYSICRAASLPNFTYQLSFATTRDSLNWFNIFTSSATCINSSSAQVLTSFATASIPADNWVWLTSTGVGSTTTEFSLTIKY